MRPAAPIKKRNEDRVLRTERQIALYRMREAAKRDRAERKEAEARVHHLNFGLVERVTYLISMVTLAVLWIAGALPDDRWLRAALMLGGAKAVLTSRRRRLGTESPTADRSGRPLI